MKILLATSNPGKFREIKDLFSSQREYFELFSLSDLHISLPFEEQGSTFLENASQKSLFYSRLAEDIAVVAEDSGLEVEALGNEPGVYSARYAGENSSDQHNLKKLLEKMRGQQNRKACFTARAALSRNGKLMKTFIGRVKGMILDSPRGNNGFGYDPVFYFPPLKRTFAELTTEEKNRVSHRARVFKKLKMFLLDCPF